MRGCLYGLVEQYGITTDHLTMAIQMVGSGLRNASLVIAPNDDPYLYRWHIVPHNKQANVYFHLQVADDPERPLHDHPWDNQSVILAGGYIEQLSRCPDRGPVHMFSRRVGDVITRMAADAHRLLLPPGVRYTMTLFSTGPKRRAWGFWYPQGWVDASDVCRLDGNKSVHIRKEV